MSAWLCDHPTQTSFPGSLTDTQASTFRFRRMSTQQRSAALSEHHSITGMSRDFHELLLIQADCHLRELSAVPNHSLFRADKLRTTSVLTGMRVVFPKGVRRFLFGNHAWTLSSRTTTAMRFRLCPTLSGELFRRRTHAAPPTYSLATMADQTATVQHKHCQQGILH